MKHHTLFKKVPGDWHLFFYRWNKYTHRVETHSNLRRQTHSNASLREYILFRFFFVFLCTEIGINSRIAICGYSRIAMRLYGKINHNSFVHLLSEITISTTNILLETGTNELEVVEFEIDYMKIGGTILKQSFGINVAKVREIIRMPSLTKLSNLPDAICGIFRLRGDIYPAVDLCKFLYNQENLNKDVKMIVTEFNNLKVGFIVNEVRKIHRITWSQVISADSMQEFSSDNSSIIGVFHLDNHNVLMLDVENIVVDIAPTSAIDNLDVGFESVKNNPIAVTAEDSAIIRKMITDKMHFAGFDLDSYNDGLSCWDRLEEIGRLVSNGASLDSLCRVIITDIEMPGMDGYTLTKKIKSHPILREIPVVLFSSIITSDLLHKGKSVGADAQMAKPQIGELLQVVKALIEDKSAINKNSVSL